MNPFTFVLSAMCVAQSSLKKTMQVAEKAQHVFRLFPPYLLGDGLIKVIICVIYEYHGL